ncbi:molybdate ABC transporter substrate-binding protein [Pseudogracilibacillus auburnensis]|uniref:Molybdate transport system substrate-binding protein n=1 Tax=Pseudogracilibacillus auburnensis TaxID=1494959 RepID=A0A2V3W0S6_9BACI|nr:molybdate ABC transporter substrate-binding protein [Pseudogracilibacillus auburnensis]PXW87376.1 molybdate transport system substrate-binding protein [Pseudogracilibacillus auburnensis]
MKHIKMLLFALFVIVFVVACSNDGGEEETTTNESEESATNESDEGTKSEGEPAELFISAAASLTDAMDEIKPLYEEEHNVELTFNFAGSGKLAQQIQQGAPVDVFISANENWMDTLVEENLIKEDTRVDVTGNKLVLIVRKDSTIDYSSFEDIELDDVEQIAIGNPESVPAGEYTEAVLKAIDKWDELESKFVFAQDVRQVLTYVETGNAEIGFVYESDAISSDQVKILTESDPSMHDAIIYPGAVTADSEQEEKANQFIEFLLSDEGQEILGKYGFNK